MYRYFNLAHYFTSLTKIKVSLTSCHPVIGRRYKGNRKKGIVSEEGRREDQVEENERSLKRRKRDQHVHRG